MQKHYCALWDPLHSGLRRYIYISELWMIQMESHQAGDSREFLSAW
jgi:hypothetical protein